MTSSNPISIALTGDFCPIGRIEEMILKGEHHGIYGEILQTLIKSDLSITNLECPLTDHLSPIPKLGPNLSASPSCIDLLKMAQFDVVTLANNHIMDQGNVGLESTIRTCESAGIKTVGVGGDLEDAEEPLFVDVKGQLVAIINCAENEFSIAGFKEPGANPLDPIRLHNTIQRAKRKTNTVLVIVHGGHEVYEYPSPRMVDTYRFIADLEVTAVVGHHTHCVSGYEWRNGVPIVYSLGNFLFDGFEEELPGWDKGALVILQVSDGKVSDMVIEPFHQCHEGVVLELLEGNDRDEFIKTIDKISEAISDRGELEKKWGEYIDKKEMAYMPHLLAMGRYERFLFRHGVDVLKRANRNGILRLLNYMQCEAHRDVSMAVLRKWINKQANRL